MQVSHPRLKRQDELFRLAETQAGYFTAAQAKKLELDYPIQSYHKTVGNWEEVLRGVYRLTHYPRNTLDHFAALTLWSHDRAGVPQAAVGFESALLHYELGDVLPSVTHLVVPRGFRKRPLQDVELHYGVWLPNEVVTHGGIRVTTPLRTLLDLAGSALSPEHLEQAVQQAVARGMVRTGTLVDAAYSLNPYARARLLYALNIGAPEMGAQ